MLRVTPEIEKKRPAMGLRLFLLTTFLCWNAVVRGPGGAFGADTLQVIGDVQSIGPVTLAMFSAPDSLFGGLQTPDGSHWFHTRDRAVRYDEATWISYGPEDGLPEGGILGMEATPDGAVWFWGGEAGRPTGLMRCSEGRWTIFPPEDFGLDDVAGIYQLRDGSVWVFGAKAGAGAAARYRSGAESKTGGGWTAVALEGGVRAARLTRMIEANSGDLWFGTESDGVLRMQAVAGGAAWSAYTTRDGLSHNRISDLFQDAEGRVWAGNRGGLSRLREDPEPGKAWISFVEQDGLPLVTARNFTAFRGELWVSFFSPFYAGVARHNGRDWALYESYEGLAHNYVRGMVAEGDRALWVATESGISRFDGATWMGVRTRAAPVIWKAEDGTTWFGTADGRVGMLAMDGDPMVEVAGRIAGPDGEARKGVSVEYATDCGRLWFRTSTDEAGMYRARVFAASYRVRTFGAGAQQVAVGQGASPGVSFATDPAIFRVAFPAAPGRRRELEQAYRKNVLPVLKSRGFRPLDAPARAAHDTLFTQLLENDAPGRIGWDWLALETHPAVKAFFGKIPRNSFRLDLYSAPLGAGRITTPVEPIRRPLGAGTAQKIAGRTTRAGTGTRQGVFLTFTATDGLASNQVNDALRDRSSRLWFATEEGVCRYDGEYLTTYAAGQGFAGKHARQMAEDRQGALWIAAETGLFRLQGETMTRFGVADGLPDHDVWTAMEDREGRLWFGTRRGVACIEGDSIRTYGEEHGLPDPWIYKALYQDAEGIWLGAFAETPSISMGVGFYDGARFTTYAMEDGLPHNRVYAVLRDRDGALWLGTIFGLCRYDGRNLEVFTSVDGLGGMGIIRRLFQDSDGTLWAGSARGLSRFEGNRFRTFGTEDGLAHHRIEAIAEDTEANLWIGTAGGISRYDGHRLDYVRTPDRPGAQAVQSLHKDRTGNLWIGTDGGLIRSRGDGLKVFTTEDGLPGNKIAFIAGDGQDGMWLSHGLWMGHLGGAAGLTHYDGRRFKTLTASDGLLSDWTGPLLIDRSGDLWAGTGGGVSRYDGRAFANWCATQGFFTGRGQTRVEALLKDRDGRVWAGFQGGAARFQGDGVEMFNTGDLADAWVHAMLEDRKGNVWFGTNNGLVRYDGRSFSRLSTDDGLISDKITALLEDRAGHLWIGTPAGISRTDGLVVQHLQKKEGLPDDRVNTLMLDDTGNVLIGTSGGLIRYRPIETPPVIEVTGVFADRIYGPAPALSLDTRQDLVAFEFTGRSFKTEAGQMAYAYRLAGYDDAWKWTRERRVTYSNLQRGDYRFEVKAVDLDLTYSEIASSVSLRVHWPYQRIGVLSGLAVAVALVFWQTGRVVKRDRRLRAANEALSDANRALFNANREIQTQTERKSSFLASMSHELRTPMNAIKGFTSLVLRREPTLSERGKANLQKVGQASDHLLALINDLLDLSKIEAGRMEVHPTRFDVGQLLASCCETINPLLREGVSLSCACEGVAEAHTDEARVRQMVINLLSNAVKFTHGGEVAVGARVYGEEGALGRQMLEISVRDTGVGIPPEKLEGIFEEFIQGPNPSGTAQKGTGLGLSITKKFAELLGGHIGVQSEVGTGSTFAIHIPLEYEQGHNSKG